jgi:hypothetical protein
MVTTTTFEIAQKGLWPLLIDPLVHDNGVRRTHLDGGGRPPAADKFECLISLCCRIMHINHRFRKSPCTTAQNMDQGKWTQIEKVHILVMFWAGSNPMPIPHPVWCM